MKKILTILLLLLCNILVFSNDKIDSLKSVIKSTLDNKQLALLYAELSKLYQGENIDSSFYFSKIGLNISNDYNYIEGKAENLGNIGDYYVIKDSLDLAKKYYIEAIDYCKQTDNYHSYAYLLLVIGNIYFVQDNTPEALQYYSQSLKICFENNIIDIQPHIFNNQGNIYSNLEDYDLALKNYLLAYDLFAELDQQYNLAIALTNIGLIYIEKSENSVAFEKFQQAIKIFESLESWIDVSNCYSQLCAIKINNNEFETAKMYLNQGLQMIDKPGFEYLAPKSLVYISLLKNQIKINIYDKQYNNAIENSLKLNELSFDNNYLSSISESFLLMSNAYELSGNNNLAFEKYKLYKQFNDSLMNEKKIKIITQMQMQFEYDKSIKDNELKQTKKDAIHQRRIFILLIIIVLMSFIIVFSFLLFLYQRNKTQKANLEKEYLNQKLEYKNKELTTNVMYLLKKNEFIVSIAKKLEKLKSEFKLENKQIIQLIINDLQSNTANFTWEEFEKRFMEVHSDFNDKLTQKYPDITPNEMKLCAFLRLNMTTKEISAITYQSVSSINMARFRLRKKMNMERDENLINYLNQL